jgi:hypothetical protein
MTPADGGRLARRGDLMIVKAMAGALLVAGTLSMGPAYAAGGQANDYLLSLSPAHQAEMLGNAVGKTCTGKTAFFMGVGVPGHPKRQALWSVKCTNGTSYAVKVNPNGAVQAIECTVFTSMDGFACFKKITVKKN